MTIDFVLLGKLIVPAKSQKAGNSSNLPILSMTMRDGLVDQQSKFKKRIASTDLSPYKVVLNGQLVVGFPIDEGVLALQRLYQEALVSPAYAIWDVNDDLVLPDYLEYFLRSPFAINYYLSKLQGSTARRRSLPQSTFLNLSVPLPEFSEQKHIVQKLQSVQKIIRNCRQATDLLVESRISGFKDMFPADSYPKKRLMDLGAVFTGKTPPGSLEGMYGEEVPFVTPGDLENIDPPKRNLSKLGAETVRTVPKGSLLVCCIGATIGKMDFARKESAFNQQLNAVVWSNQIDPVYGLFAAKSLKTVLKAKSSNTTMPLLNKSDFQELEIPVPPFELQKRYSLFVESTYSLEYQLLERLSIASELFLSIQNEAFNQVRGAIE